MQLMLEMLEAAARLQQQLMPHKQRQQQQRCGGSCMGCMLCQLQGTATQPAAAA
jgi:hypothetical protein